MSCAASTAASSAGADASSPSSSLLRLCVQNMAGGVLNVELPSDALVSELKRHVADWHADYVTARQRLFVPPHDSHDAPADPIVLANDRTLSSYALGQDATVHVVIVSYAPGEHVRTIECGVAPTGVCCVGDEVFISGKSMAKESGNRRNKIVVCDALDGAVKNTFSSNFIDARMLQRAVSGDCMLVTETGKGCLELLDVDGTVIRTLESTVSFQSALDACFSVSGEEIYVAEWGASRVQVVSSHDGQHRRHIGGDVLRTPEGVCVSPCGQFLFVADYGNNAVRVFATADDSLVRTISAVDQTAAGTSLGGDTFDPVGICVSATGDVLYVVDHANGCVRVFRTADGAHVRNIGQCGRGVNALDRPWGVCLSPLGDLLYVASRENNRVQVYGAEV